MKKVAQHYLLALLFVLLSITNVYAGNTTDAQNLSVCLQGNLRSLCNHTILTPNQKEQVESAEYQANLSTCLQGSLRSLCRHEVLKSEDQVRVKEAEYQANRSTCLQGSLRSLCRHEILESKDQTRVKEAEYQANLKTCLGGYSYGCDVKRLSESDASKVKELKAASQSAQTAYPPSPTTSLPTTTGACAENGSCYGDISSITGIPKTISVRGYYRKDGTYVRGHYRSHR